MNFEKTGQFATLGAKDAAACDETTNDNLRRWSLVVRRWSKEGIS